jgi:serine protease Do
MKRALGHISMALAGGLLALGAQDLLMDKKQPVDQVSTLSTAPEVRYVNMPIATGAPGAPFDLTMAAEHSVETVVHVTTETMVNVRDPFADFFWGHRAPSTPQPRQGAGSGVIITDDGYIVTNNHVVDGADKIQVHLNDRRQYEATVVGRDPSTDLALLKIDVTGLAVMPFGNSDDVRVGQWVLAVGNPMNLTSTVTAGIVSAKSRNINLLQYDPGKDLFPIESFIQTDAAVNPGNSGGALVDATGQLVGINTAIASTTGSYAGYSFAIPVNIVKKVTSDLLEYGSVQRAFIGVSIRDIDQRLAKEMKLNRLNGVYVNGITDGGAAQQAGVKEGDIITRVGNIEVNNVTQLQEQVGRFRPGDKVAVTVMRNGKEDVLDMVLRGREGAVAAAAKKASPAMSALGAELRSPTAEELRALRLEGGVKVTNVQGGKFRSSGIREGFIITGIDQQPVSSPEDVQRLLEQKRGGVLIEGYYPNGTKAYYGLGL